MTIKKRNSQHNSEMKKDKAIEVLADKLADKPYGQEIKDADLARTTISLPSSILFKLEDIAKLNKRNNNELRSVSAIIRDCIEKTLKLS
jgi:hypothetical protein